MIGIAVYKDNATGMWRVIYCFTNWKGEPCNLHKDFAVFWKSQDSRD